MGPWITTDAQSTTSPPLYCHQFQKSKLALQLLRGMQASAASFVEKTIKHAPPYHQNAHVVEHRQTLNFSSTAVASPPLVRRRVRSGVLGQPSSSVGPRPLRDFPPSIISGAAVGHSNKVSLP
jgi:hypothetical protein